MFLHKTFFILKHGLTVLLVCIAFGAAANGTLYGAKYCGANATPLVAGGIGSKLTLKPRLDKQMITEMGSYPEQGKPDSWLAYNPYGGVNDNDSIDVEIVANPDTVDRTGYIWLRSKNAAGTEALDTIYVFQPGVRCMDPKQGNTGSDFFVAFMRNAEASSVGQLYLYATSDVAANVTVLNNSTGNSIGSTTIVANQMKSIYHVSGSAGTLQTSPAYNYRYQEPLKRSLRVTADQNISLYAYNQESTTSEMACILPTAALSDEYFALSYSGNYEKPEALMIIATEDATLVTITPADETYGKGTYSGTGNTTGADYKIAGDPFTITLQAGETYLIRSKSRGRTGSSSYYVKPGLTGTHVKSSKPIAVFGGHERAALGCEMNSNRDHLYEQLLPLRSWGQKYALAETSQPNNIYRIVAAYDNTTVTITDKNGLVKTLKLNRGKYAEGQFNSKASALYGNRISPFVYIEADRPVEVGLFALSTGCTSPTSSIADPFLIALGPADRGIFSATFSPVKIDKYNNTSPLHYITVITEQRYKDSTKLYHTASGMPPTLMPLAFEDMPGTPYAYASEEVYYQEKFNYQLSNPYGFTAYAYGYGYLESYGYTIGAQLGEKIMVEGDGSSIPDSVIYCRNEPYRPFPKCVDGGDCSDPAKERNRYYWYNTLEDWYNDKPLPAPPEIDVKIDSAYTYFASWWGRCDILYPKQVAIKVLPLPAVTFANDTVCLSSTTTDYGARPLGGTYTYAGTNATFDHSKATPGTHSVTYTYTNERGCSDSRTAMVTVETLDKDPYLRVVSGDASFCRGETLVLEVANAVGRTFQWYYNGAPIDSADKRTYRVEPKAKVYETGTYSAHVINKNGCMTTVDTIATIYEKPEKPIIVTASAAGCAPFTYELYDYNYVSAAGYQWYKTEVNDANKIDGATGDTYKVLGDTIAGKRHFVYGVATKVPGRSIDGGCWSYDEIDVEVYARANTPSIFHKYGDGVTVPVCDGDSVKLTATAISGNSYTWQWYAKFSDGSTSKYLTSEEISVKAGEYLVESTSEHGCPAKERSKLVTVVARGNPGKPVIAAGASVCTGDTVTLIASALAPGGVTTTYDWYAATQSGAYDPIDKATGATYGATESGSYAVLATTHHGDVDCSSPYSNPKPVTILPKPSPPEIKGKTDVCVSANNISLTASAASGSVEIESYRWYKNGVHQQGIIGNTYAATQSEAATIYKVVAYSKVGRCISDADSVTVTVHRPEVLAITGAKDTCYGQTVALKAVTNVVNPNGYVWYENDKLTAEASSSYLVRGKVSETTNGTYYVYVSDHYGCQSPKSAEVKVNIHKTVASLTVNSQPVCAGEELTLEAAGATANLYDWYLEKSGSRTLVGKTTTSSLVIPKAQDANAGKYVVEIENTNGCKSGGEGNAVVYSLPVAPTLQPTALHICFGDSTRILASSSTTQPVYEWFFRNTDNIKVSLPSSLERVYPRQPGRYTARVKGQAGCWSGESEEKYIETHLKPEAPTISSLLSFTDTIKVCESKVTPITASAAGAKSYQWYAVDPGGKSYIEISGATGATYDLQGSGLYAAKAFMEYSTDGATPLTCPSVSYSEIKVAEVYPEPAPPVISGNSSACAGQKITLTANTATGDHVASFQWYKNSKMEFSSTTATFEVTEIANASYTVEAISDKGCASARSVAQSVSIRRPIVSLAQPKPSSICYGGTVTLTATTNTDLNSKYEWYEGNTPIPGATALSYVVKSDATAVNGKKASYSLYVTDEGGCKSAQSNTATVTINPLPPTPAVSITSSPHPVCEGGSVTLNASPAGEGRYQWYFEKNGAHKPVGVESNATTLYLPNILSSNAGPYSVQITNEYGCTSAAPQREVKVNASPATPMLTANLTNSSDSVHICTGDSVLLTAFSADAKKYEWYVGAGRLPDSANRFYAKMPIIYSVWGISEDGCRSNASDAMTVGVHARPEKPTILPAGNISVCANGSTPITGLAANASSYQWYSVDPSTGASTLISGATAGRYDVSKSGRYAVRADILYRGSGYQLTCETVSEPKPIEVFPLPLPPLLKGEKMGNGGEKTSGCDGDILTLTASVPAGKGVTAEVTSYRWYKDDVELTSATDSVYTITQVEAARYKVEAISNKGCESEASASKEIVIRPLPTVSIADGVRETCGGTITLTATPAATGATYDWFENGNAIQTASTSPSYVVQGNSDATKEKAASYYLYATDKYGCHSAAPSSEVKVTIRALPPSPTATAASVCNGDNATLKVSPSGAGRYKWYKRSGRSSLDSMYFTSDTNYLIREAQPADAGQYVVEIINTHGCKSALMGEVGLTVQELPEVRIIEPRACESWTEENTVKFATPTGGRFTGWGCTVDGKFNPSEVHQGVASVKYTYTAPNGCTNSDEKIIEIISLPNTPIVAADGATEVCEDSVMVKLQTNVAAEYAADYTYRWRKDGATIPSETTSAYVATKAGAYDVRICNKGLCWSDSTSDPVKIVVKELPDAPLIAAQDVAFFCPGSVTKLLAHSEAPGTFQWYKGDSKGMSEMPTEIAGSYNAGEVGQYAVKLFGENECWSPLSSFITVGEYPLPRQPEIIPSQTTLYAGLTYALLVKTPQPGEEYGWYKNDLSTDKAGISYPVASLSSEDTGRYTVRTLDEHGCSVWSDVYTLAWSEAPLFVPNVFTPNGDGINDYFQILGLEGFVENKLEILNKRGVVIFSRKNYRNEWNGNGFLNDVYYYTLELKREDETTSLLRGYVHMKK
ncbi:MAG: gliding motility-associated C-terminal domain-containing protein [Prevotellaceae bacterium]|jgi:gliding motility-associated-like protein|nr:gliding motility-associated C-terminal domain-containing protein [Prevotellaceae bacterium]